MTTQASTKDTAPARAGVDFGWWDALLVALVFVASVAAGWWG